MGKGRGLFNHVSLVTMVKHKSFQQYIAVQNLNRATVNYHMISEKANQIYATVQFVTFE